MSPHIVTTTRQSFGRKKKGAEAPVLTLQIILETVGERYAVGTGLDISIAIAI